MDAAWIGVIGTLSGGILVGAVSYVTKRMELKHQRRLDGIKIRLIKLEEIHHELGEFTNAITLYINGINVLMAEGETDKLRREFYVQTRLFSDRLTVVGFKIRLHAPRLIDSWNPAMEQLTDLTEYFTEVAVRAMNSSRALTRQEYMPFNTVLSQKGITLAAHTLILQQGIQELFVSLNESP